MLQNARKKSCQCSLKFKTQIGRHKNSTCLNIDVAATIRQGDIFGGSGVFSVRLQTVLVFSWDSSDVSIGIPSNCCRLLRRIASVDLWEWERQDILMLCDASFGDINGVWVGLLHPRGEQYGSTGIEKEE